MNRTVTTPREHQTYEQQQQGATSHKSACEPMALVKPISPWQSLQRPHEHIGAPPPAAASWRCDKNSLQGSSACRTSTPPNHHQLVAELSINRFISSVLAHQGLHLARRWHCRHLPTWRLPSCVLSCLAAFFATARRFASRRSTAWAALRTGTACAGKASTSWTRPHRDHTTPTSHNIAQHRTTRLNAGE